MARLHEYQGKAILSKLGIPVPRGWAATSETETADIARELGVPVVIKIQAYTTGRAAIGGIALAATADQARSNARRMLGMRVGRFAVTHLLVEEQLSIASEVFVSFAIDERERAPVLLIGAVGGSGVEGRSEQVRRLACDVRTGPRESDLARVASELTSSGEIRAKLAAVLRRVCEIARQIDARSLEINPLAITTDARVVAADCRVTIDDYAVFRHPELGIDFAREFDHPPTPLERVAYAVEQADHRGTFYFAQMAAAAESGSRGLVGFHGAGGGGSMMAMDAITTEGFAVANFADTSGNPSSAKVYRAARIILSQPGLVGYFGSGSGVASQEQFWSAYGLAKAFWEVNLDVPAVIRLGGNTEDRAVDILCSACKELPARVEGYRKTDSPRAIAHRLAELVEAGGGRTWTPRTRRVPRFVGSSDSVSYAILGGRVWIDAARWSTMKAAAITNSAGLLRDDHGRPALAVSEAELARKDSELIACEVECRRIGMDAVFVDMDIPGLAEAAGRA